MFKAQILRIQANMARRRWSRSAHSKSILSGRSRLLRCCA